MKKVCLHCGEMMNSECCEKCGKHYGESLGKVDSVTIVGTKIQVLVRISFSLALINLCVGPLVSFIAMFSPMLPKKLFEVLSVQLCLYLMCAVPIVSLVCVLLNWITKRNYKIEKHAPRNKHIAELSYRFSVWAILGWLLVMVAGMGVTLYGYMQA